MMLYVWNIVALEALLEIGSRFFEVYIKPITDVDLYDGINKMLYDKACQVDLLCFENSEFYNEYMMAVSQAHVKLPDTLQGVCQIVSRFAAMIAAAVIIYQIDHFAILFAIFPILGNFVFYGILNGRIFRMDCIYMMEKGRIVESGAHEKLLAENGKYAAMWNMQAGLYADAAKL